MIITVTPIAPDTAGPPIVLGNDDGGDIIIDPPLMPSTQRPAQIQALARADRQFAVGRGNRLTSFSWRVSRQQQQRRPAYRRTKSSFTIICLVAVSDGGSRPMASFGPFRSRSMSMAL